MNPVRRSDWRSRLSACIQGALAKPFSWGSHDCALFAADAILAMTDVDLAAGFRGHYSTPRGAIRLVRRVPHADHLDLAAALLPEIAPAFATDGDIGVVESSDRPVLGLFVGDLIAAPGVDGLMFVPRADATRAFHVPFVMEAN